MLPLRIVIIIHYCRTQHCCLFMHYIFFCLPSLPSVPQPVPPVWCLPQPAHCMALGWHKGLGSCSREEPGQGSVQHPHSTDQPSPSVLHPLLEHLWVLHPGRVVTTVQGVPTGIVCILGWLWKKKIISGICNAKAALLMGNRTLYSAQVYTSELCKSVMENILPLILGSVKP